MSYDEEDDKGRKAQLKAEALKKFKPAKALGANVDKLYQLRAERLALQKAADAIGALEGLYKDHIINTFSKDEINGAKGKLASCSINPRVVPTVKDWEAFYAYVHKNKAYELFQRRVNEKAWKERLENKKVVPGVESFNITALSLTKL